MNTSETVISTIQSNDIEKMLITYQKYMKNASITFDNLFLFLSHPTADREEFLHDYCTCNYLVQEQIISPNYLVK